MLQTEMAIRKPQNSYTTHLYTTLIQIPVIANFYFFVIQVYIS